VKLQCNNILLIVIVVAVKKSQHFHGISRQQEDDDGNAASGETERMPDTAVDEWIDAMNNAPDLNALKQVFSECWGKAKKLNDTDAKNAFQKTYEAKKRSLL